MSIERASGGSSPIDVFDRVLDKGIVIDAWVRLFLVGIDLITVEARVVVASITTCLQFSEAVGISPVLSSAAIAALPSTFPASAEVASDAAATRHDNGGPRDSTNGDPHDGTDAPALPRCRRHQVQAASMVTRSMRTRESRTHASRWTTPPSARMHEPRSIRKDSRT